MAQEHSAQVVLFHTFFLCTEAQEHNLFDNLDLNF